MNWGHSPLVVVIVASEHSTQNVGSTKTDIIAIVSLVVIRIHIVVVALVIVVVISHLLVRLFGLTVELTPWTVILWLLLAPSLHIVKIVTPPIP